jgi:hypothetical protein
MKIKDVIEWLQIADDDLDSAVLLNGAIRKHNDYMLPLCPGSRKILEGLFGLSGHYTGKNS